MSSRGQLVADDAELVQNAVDEQQKRYQADVWEQQIAEWVKNPRQRVVSGRPAAEFTSNSEWVTIDDLLNHCIGKDLEFWTQSDKNRIAACLTSLGWERHRIGPRTTVSGAIGGCPSHEQVSQLVSHSNSLSYQRVSQCPSLASISN